MMSANCAMPNGECQVMLEGQRDGGTWLGVWRCKGSGVEER